MRVLIVEDNPLLGYLIETSLLDAGHDALGPVPNIDDALAIIESGKPELAFVDINLDGGSTGLLLASALYRHAIPFFYASGQAEIARTDRSRAMGLLPKPFSPELLVKVVEAVESYLAGKGDVAFPEGIERFEGGAGPHR